MIREAGRRDLVSTIARLSLAEYDRMIACGAFDSDRRRRIELIRGELREMTPIGAPHEVVVDRLTEWSFESLAKGKAWVRVQNSIGLEELESAPEPDLAWVARKDYSKRRPEGRDVLLVVEVAESSLRYDCGEKAELYAAAGIRDYWVVNLVDRVIEVRRDPLAGRYRSLQTFSGDEELHPLMVPDVTLRPARLFSAISA
jgi:Uma2 family endonuclease